MVDRKPSLFNPKGNPKEVTRNVLDPVNAAEYEISVKNYNSQTSNYGGRQDFEDYARIQSEAPPGPSSLTEQRDLQYKETLAAPSAEREKGIIGGWGGRDITAYVDDMRKKSEAVSLLRKGPDAPEAISDKVSADEVGTKIYEAASKVASKGSNIVDTTTQTFATAGINELLYGSPEPEVPYASYQALADTREHIQPLTHGPIAGQEIDASTYLSDNTNAVFSSYGMQAEDGTSTYNTWAPQVSMYPRA